MDVIVAGGEKVRLVGWVLVGVRGDRVGVNREEGIWAGSVHREGGLVVVGVCGALGAMYRLGGSAKGLMVILMKHEVQVNFGQKHHF